MSQDADLAVSCQNGADPEAAELTRGHDEPSRSVPAVEVENCGTIQGSCADRRKSEVTSREL